MPTSSRTSAGHFFSEGHYDILGAPTTDGYDALDWIAKQPWSNGKVGTTGCSSTAEYQMAIAGLDHPAYAAMNVQGFGAGVGRVRPYFEQGNWYRGGATQMLFIAWLHGEQNQLRPMFPRDMPREDLVQASRYFDLAAQIPAVDWSKALWHLPVQDILKAVDGQRGIFSDPMPVPTGGRMVQRAPNDPAWYKGGLFHDDDDDQHPGAVVHVVVRRVGGPEPRALQPRPQDGTARGRRPAVGDHRPGRALLLHPRHRGHRRRRAQHG